MTTCNSAPDTSDSCGFMCIYPPPRTHIHVQINQKIKHCKKRKKEKEKNLSDLNARQSCHWHTFLGKEPQPLKLPFLSMCVGTSVWQESIWWQVFFSFFFFLPLKIQVVLAAKSSSWRKWGSCVYSPRLTDLSGCILLNPIWPHLSKWG